MLTYQSKHNFFTAFLNMLIESAHTIISVTQFTAIQTTESGASAIHQI
jgi:hypothetical protein